MPAFKTVAARHLWVAIILAFVFSSCVQSKTEEELMLQTEINNGQATPPPPPAAGDQLPQGRWTVDTIGLGDQRKELEGRLGKPTEMGNPPSWSFPNHVAQVTFDAQNRPRNMRCGDRDRRRCRRYSCSQW